MNVKEEIERLLEALASTGTIIPPLVSRENAKLLMEIAFNEGQRVAYREMLDRTRTLTTKTPIPPDNLG